MTIPPEAALSRLLEIMARLRSPIGGCPWDQLQRFETIAPYTVEEAYEVADVIGRGPDMTALLDELGDLLFQVVYHARMAEEAGAFGFGEIAEAISRKMVRRHPHVFGDAPAENPGWEMLKQRERAALEDTGVLAGVPAGLPSLTRALKLTRRAARVGFDWPDADSVFLKLAEEVEELRAEIPGQDPVRLADELGDLLFVVANLGRKLGLDPEACLQAANAKFTRRFNAVEAQLGARGLSPGDAGLAAMETEWQAVKSAERGADVPSPEPE
jgi:ATP diphosphatase